MPTNFAMLSRDRAPLHRGQRGLSIIELMVGVALGLFILGGALALFVSLMGDNRRLLLEARVNQEIRATADIIARDLRRAGYWRNAMAGVGATPVANPYGGATWAGTSVQYAYDRDGNSTVTGSEQAGFQLNGNVIATNTGQPLTDPNTIQVTTFTLPANAAAATQWTDLAYACECISKGTCTEAALLALAPGHANRPQVGLRTATIVIEAQATADARVKRRIEETVRIRNDLTRGACPA